MNVNELFLNQNKIAERGGNAFATILAAPGATLEKLSLASNLLTSVNAHNFITKL